MTTTSDASAASATFTASAAFEVNGFSHRTCLPAAMAFSVHSACSPFGNGMSTASTSGSLTMSSYDVCTRGMSCFAANSFARCGSRAAIAVTAAPGTARAGFTMAGGAIRAAPSTPMRRSPTTGDFLLGLLDQGDAVAAGDVRAGVDTLEPGTGDELAHELGRVDDERHVQLVPVELAGRVAQELPPSQLRQGVGVLDDRAPTRPEHAVDLAEVVVDVPVLQMNEDTVGERGVDGTVFHAGQPLPVAEP